jgi:hypothetical protein
MKRTRKPRALLVVGVTIMAIVIAVTYATARKPSDYVGAAGALCLLWSIVFGPTPSGTKTIRDVYVSAQSGWRVQPAAKVMGLIGIILVAVGYYMRMHAS